MDMIVENKKYGHSLKMLSEAVMAPVANDVSVNRYFTFASVLKPFAAKGSLARKTTAVEVDLLSDISRRAVDHGYPVLGEAANENRFRHDYEKSIF